MNRNSFTHVLRRFGWSSMTIAGAMLDVTGGEGMVDWNFVSENIRLGCPLFPTDDIVINKEERLFVSQQDIVYSNSFLKKVRQVACPNSFSYLLHFFKQKLGSHSLVAQNFYHSIKTIDRVILNFLFDLFRKKEAIPHLSNEENEHLLHSLRKQVPMFDEKMLKKSIVNYSAAFIEKMKENYDPESIIHSEPGEIYGDKDDLSWMSRLLLYINQPLVIATIGVGLLSLVCCWKSRRKQAHSWQTLIMTIREQLPGDGWQSEYSFNKADIKISYQLAVKDYLLLQTEQESYSITQDTLEKYFHRFFTRITVKGEPCQVSSGSLLNEQDTDDEKTHRRRWLRLELPPMKKDDDKWVQKFMTEMSSVQDEFWHEVRKNAPEVQILEFSRIQETLLTPIDLHHKGVMHLLEYKLNNTQAYQRTIDKIVNFLKKSVLINAFPSRSMAVQIKKISEVAFSDLKITEKIGVLLWLYRQLNTIAQLILDPYASVLEPCDFSHVRFYRLFAEMIREKKNELHEVEKFSKKMWRIVGQVDLTGDFTSQSITEGIENYLTRFLIDENKKKSQLSAHYSSRNLKDLKPQQRHQQLEILKASVASIEASLHFDGYLPLVIDDFLAFMKDSEGANAHQLMQWMPRISLKRRSQLEADYRKRVSPKTTVLLAQQEIKSETVNHWSQRFQALIGEDLNVKQNPTQINLGLFYCLSRIILLLKEEFPRDKFPSEHFFLEHIRYLWGHFACILSFESKKTLRNFSEFHAVLMSMEKTNFRRLAHLPSTVFLERIKESKLYKTLAHHSTQKDNCRFILSEEHQAIEKLVHGLQESVYLYSQLISFTEKLMMHGLIIIYGQASRDLANYCRLDKTLADQLKMCVSIRNGLMHDPHYSLPDHWLESLSNKLQLGRAPVACCPR